MSYFPSNGNNHGYYNPQPAAGGASGLLTGLLAYYKLTEDSGNRLDSSGNGLTLSPANAPTSGLGKIGSGMAVNGVNQHADSSGNIAIDYTTPFTITFWAFPAVFPGSGLSFGIIGLPTNTPMNVTIRNNGTITVFRFGQNANTVTIDTTASTPLNAWTFVMIRWTPGTRLQEIGVNATTPVSQVGSALTTTNQSVIRVGTVSAQNSFFNGVLDEVGAWNRVLTDQEIATLYNGGTGLTYPFS